MATNSSGEPKPIIHYYWLRRWQAIPTDPEEFVDTACGIEIPLKRATETRDRVTCRRCLKSRN